ncbi:MAG TPA: M20/M25/M40 family metallo-hydrolase, partial [Candidatus Acidoferrales bacterium]|nr:M20/M25/M40 family metallo-hydrolase [Candidatus Acidoferrales bacterium]
MRLLIVSLCATLCASTVAAQLTPEQSRLREIYKQLVEINTTHSTGGTTAAAEAVAKRLRAAGIRAKDIQILGPVPNKQNLVARLHGNGTRQPLLLLAHLDVVEAKRSDWSIDPFKLNEKDGYFYGRGTLDDKAMAAIFVDIFLRLNQQKVKLDRDVILALTADEEGGPDDGAKWLVQTHRPLVDAEMVLNEGGGGRTRQGKYLNNGVQASEKAYMSYRLEVRNPGGHSSLPRKDNAIYQLAAALGRLQQFEFPFELNEVTRLYFEQSARTESPEVAADMQAILHDPPDAAAVKRLSDMPSYNALLRTTCVPTRLEGGHADNALPQTAAALVNCRIMPGHSGDEVQKVLAGVIGDDQVTIAPTEVDTSGPASPLNLELMKSIERLTNEMWPGVPVLPTMSSGATDSRYFRQAGIPAYGVSGLFVDVDDVRAHGRDERLGVKELYDGQTF